MINLEQEWLEKARHGDEDAFTTLVETYQTPVYNLCFRMLGDGGSAEDASQETFWRAWQNLNRYDPQRSFITWLLSIAAHFCIDQQRKRRVSIFEMDEFPDFDISNPLEPTPEKIVTLDEEDSALHKLINQLNPQDRAAVILKYWHDCSEEEISQMLNLTVSAVKSRLHRSRRQLAEFISSGQTTNIKKRRHNESPAL